MDQIEVLKQTLITKNREIEELKKLMKAGIDITAKKTSMEKSMWALLFVLHEKYVKCEKCGGKTKPATNKHNFMLSLCRKCGHWQIEKQSKGATFNAYFNDFRRATDG